MNTTKRCKIVQLDSLGHARDVGRLAGAATGRRGWARRYSDLAIETGHLLRRAFHQPWRQTEGLLRSIATLLGVSIEIPDHTTFSRRSVGLSLATEGKWTTGSVHVVIDSTGLKVCGAGEWQAEKHGERGRRSWCKLHLAVNPDSGEILASELTSNEVGDCTTIGPLLNQIQNPLLSVMACRVRLPRDRGTSTAAASGGDHSATTHRKHSGEREERLAKGGRLRPAGTVRNSHVSLQNSDRSPFACLNFRRSEERSPDRLLHDQPDDSTRNASLAAGLIRQPSESSVCS